MKESHWANVISCHDGARLALEARALAFDHGYGASRRRPGRLHLALQGQVSGPAPAHQQAGPRVAGHGRVRQLLRQLRRHRYRCEMARAVSALGPQTVLTETRGQPTAAWRCTICSRGSSAAPSPPRPPTRPARRSRPTVCAPPCCAALCCHHRHSLRLSVRSAHGRRGGCCRRRHEQCDRERRHGRARSGARMLAMPCDRRSLCLTCRPRPSVVGFRQAQPAALGGTGLTGEELRRRQPRPQAPSDGGPPRVQAAMLVYQPERCLIRLRDGW
jgi:hypothetical protein